MPHYAPELCASVIDQYLHTDKPVAAIARDHAINERDVTRIRHAAGVPPRGQRVRALPPAMRLLQEATRRLKAAAPPNADVGRNKRGEAERIAPDDAERVADVAGGAMRCAYCALRAHTEPPSPFSDASAIARLERLIEQELAALEATRAELGALARAPIDAERCARILSILTQTLQRLMRLRAGAAPEQGSSYDDDDMPTDMDGFRNELARRIRALVQSWTGEGVCGAVESADGAAIKP
jgi:alkylhydroperoxidase family enzyme